jgi:hypothetical protein
LISPRVRRLPQDSLIMMKSPISLSFSGPDRTSALRVVALSFQVTASVLTKAGIADLAWIAAERGLT